MSRRPNLETRQKIVDAALKLFYKGGFRGVSMDRVATAAGIKKANLFHYYHTKEELGLAVFDLAGRKHREAILSQLEGGEQDPIGTVRALFFDTCGWMRGKGCTGGCFVGNLAQELSDQNERIRQKISEHLQFWTDRLAAFLDGARRKGRFKKSFDASEAAEAIVALFEGALLFSKARKDPGALENAGRMAEAYLKSNRA